MEIKDLINDNVAFHCDTEEKAREFINKAHELGYTWSNSYEDTIYFDKYANITYYMLHETNKKISFDTMGFFEGKGCKIIEYELDKTENKLTPLEYLMEYWDIKEGEKFNIIYENGVKITNNPYYFENGDLFDKYEAICNEEFVMLINGIWTVEKFPWKPIGGDLVWYIGEDGCVYDAMCTGIAADLAMFKNGWFFKTKEEAENNKEMILAEYKEVLEK